MSSDPRASWPELAERVTAGLDVGVGTRVAVSLSDPAGYDLARELCRRTLDLGGIPQLLLNADDVDRHALGVAADDVLRTPAPLEAAALDWAEVYISLRVLMPPAEEPSDIASDELDRRRVLQRLAKGDISTRRWQQTRWAVVRVPTAEWAAFAGVDPDVVLGEFIDGTLMDWRGERRRWERLATELDAARDIHIRDVDTDLRLRVAGRTWAVFAGEANFPDGELATAPLDDGVEGHITFPGPFWFSDSRFEDLRLTFEAGRCVDVTAGVGARLARSLITADDGACRVGELGIGVNHAMRTTIGDLFVDEKILGTVHIAMGRAYPQCGGINTSSIHWDLVKDLRPRPGSSGGRVHVDGAAIIDGGVPAGVLARYTGSELRATAAAADPKIHDTFDTSDDKGRL